MYESLEQLIESLDKLSTNDLANLVGQSMIVLFKRLRGMSYKALIIGTVTKGNVEIRIIDNANSQNTGYYYEDTYNLSVHRG